GEKSLDLDSHLCKLPHHIHHTINTFVMSHYKQSHYEKNQSHFHIDLNQYSENVDKSISIYNSSMIQSMINQSFLLFGLGQRREREKLKEKIQDESNSIRVFSNADFINKDLISSEEDSDEARAFSKRSL